ncbi:hypothetical protein FOA52_000941 [Chlamydomonas sp. UWO 241]|nr:hypothetical protein FOA52_000941 [Chlamydomonas sp. UWO 241]
MLSRGAQQHSVSTTRHLSVAPLRGFTLASPVSQPLKNHSICSVITAATASEVEPERSPEKPEQKRKAPSANRGGLSLFTGYSGLPQQGRTISETQEACDPYAQRCQTPSYVYEGKCSRCQTPSYVYEGKCSVCSGTGQARALSRRGHRGLIACVVCKGLGYVRITTTNKALATKEGAQVLARDTST